MLLGPDTLFMGHSTFHVIIPRHRLVMVCNTVDLVKFARFYFSRFSIGGQIRKFKNLAKIIIIIALISAKL